VCELKALCLVDKHFQPFFLLVFSFWIRSHFLPESDWDHDPPTFASHITGITDVYHHTQLTCWDGVLLTFCSD
jgi:hypothetical protein